MSASRPDSDDARSLWLLAGMLGLSIAGHVGTIEARNREAGGASFTVRLPIGESSPMS